MSSPTPDTGPGTTGANPLSSMLTAGTKLISPRANAEAPTIVKNVANVIGTTWDLVKKTTATVLDVPLGTAEAVIAGVNNAIGAITTGVDFAVVQPINKIRSKVSQLLNSPSKILAA